MVWMSILKMVKPNFWDHEDIAAGPYKHLFNLRRIWKLTILLTAGVTLIPMIALTLIDHIVTLKTIEAQTRLEMSRLVANTSKIVSLIVTEKISILKRIARNNPPKILRDQKKLTLILDRLKRETGGFKDLEVIESDGTQSAYAGSQELKKKTYKSERWYQDASKHGISISRSTEGLYSTPHLNLAVKSPLTDTSYIILRATFDFKKFNNMLSLYNQEKLGDAFIVDQEGILQTPSSRFGQVLNRFPLTIPRAPEHVKILMSPGTPKEPLIVGAVHITKTPFRLIMIKEKNEVLEPWRMVRNDLLKLLIASAIIMLVVIIGVATHLVQKIHVADQRRIVTLHQVEYQNKLASIGRLAAGAAHEINNPLAIINEKAGLIRDIFTLGDPQNQRVKLINLVDSIRSSVGRCGRITKSLLNFVHHIEVKYQSINLELIIVNVITLLKRDAEDQSILISKSVEDGVPEIESDQSHLQQIFLNLVNNSFGALKDGGHLDISVKRKGGEFVTIEFRDDRPKIPETALKRIFDPFFSTQGRKVGTGLGLPITYGLVQEIGGILTVTSNTVKGTCFMIRLPVKMDK
jgi:signal transduction histidine kinase